MIDQDIFDIKNYRLVHPKQTKTQGVQRHPLQQSASIGLDLITFEGERLQPVEDFGTVYVGELMRAMAQIRYKQHINQVLDYVSIEVIVQAEEDQKKVKIAEARVQNIKGGDEISVPFSMNMSVEKSLIFSFIIKYKAKPFINNPANAPIIPENQKIKQYRISPKLPFLIDKSINIALYPTYYIEYSLQAKTQTEFIFKTVSFLPDSDLFDAQLIGNSQSGVVCLKPEEKEKVIFKVEVKPSQINRYKGLLLKDLANINIGSIFLEWGICGAYMSKPEEVPLIRNDIELEFAEKPDLILKKVSKCKVIITNPMKLARKLKIYLRDVDMEGIKIVGLDNTVVDFTQDLSGKFELGIHVLPHQPGIQCIKGLTFWNEETRKYSTVRNLLSVLVRTQDEPLQFQMNQNKIEEVIDFFADNYQSQQLNQGGESYQNRNQEDEDIQDFFSDNTTAPQTNNIYVNLTNQNMQNINQNSNNSVVKQNLDSIFDDDLLDFGNNENNNKQQINDENLDLL